MTVWLTCLEDNMLLAVLRRVLQCRIGSKYYIDECVRWYFTPPLHQDLHVPAAWIAITYMWSWSNLKTLFVTGKALLAAVWASSLPCHIRRLRNCPR